MARILIVDDQKSVLLTLESLLTQDGHSVVACSNALDALEVLTKEPMELLITDAIMPGGSDGYALTRTIRKDANLSKMPIILLTGKRERTDIEKGITAGVNDYIVKPMDPELLLAKVRNLLVTKAQPAVQFAEAAVSYKADWESKTEITAVSELGFHLTSNFPLPQGRIVRLNSSIFDEIGIPKIPLRIDRCDEVPGSDPTYKIQGHFIGISEKEMAPLRLWIRHRASR